MEKLLSKQHKNKTNHATSLTGQRTKIFFLAMGATKIFFCQHTSEKHFNQPFPGCFILVNQYQDYYY